MVIKLKPAETKVLNVLAARKATFDEEEVEKSKIAGYAKMGGSTMRNAISALLKKGLITVKNGRASITKEGLQHANPDAMDMPTSNEAHHDKVKATLKKNEVALFDTLMDGLPQDKKTTAKAIGMETNSTWRNMLAKLLKDNIIQYEGQNVRLHKDMFPIIPRPE